MYSVSVDNFEAWRTAARAYLSANVSPTQIHWYSGRQAGLFDSQLSLQEQTANTPSNQQADQLLIPSAFLSQLKQASCYLGKTSAEAKWALFYSLLWRVCKVNRQTLSLKTDVQVQQLERMVKSVNRDMHKMKAFLRFKVDKSVFDEIDSAGQKLQPDEHYTAWFEPEHDIVKAIAPFFVKRFTGMTWSILTPHGCAHWIQQQLIHSPGH